MSNGPARLLDARTGISTPHMQLYKGSPYENLCIPRAKSAVPCCIPQECFSPYVVGVGLEDGGLERNPTRPRRAYRDDSVFDRSVSLRFFDSPISMRLLRDTSRGGACTVISSTPLLKSALVLSVIAPSGSGTVR